MRGFLVGLAVLGSFIIVAALVHQKPVEPPQIAVISTESPVTSTPQVQPKTELPPDTTKMPEAVIITSWQDANAKISDPGLRTFVRRKANFRSDRVLYFEWRGAADDKLTGDLVSQEQKYIITLHPSPTPFAGREVMHRQVFVIPMQYSHCCEIAK